MTWGQVGGIERTCCCTLCSSKQACSCARGATRGDRVVGCATLASLNRACICSPLCTSLVPPRVHLPPPLPLLPSSPRPTLTARHPLGPHLVDLVARGVDLAPHVAEEVLPAREARAARREEEAAGCFGLRAGGAREGRRGRRERTGGWRSGSAAGRGRGRTGRGRTRASTCSSMACAASSSPCASTYARLTLRSASPSRQSLSALGVQDVRGTRERERQRM